MSEADQKRKAGFYRVTVKEFGGQFDTIGLWHVYGSNWGTWKFAQGDGDEMGASFTVVSVDENMIMEDEYWK